MLPQVGVLVGFHLIIPVLAVALGKDGAAGKGQPHLIAHQVESILAVVGNGQSGALFLRCIQEPVHIELRLRLIGTVMDTVGGFGGGGSNGRHGQGQLHQVPGMVEPQQQLHLQSICTFFQNIVHLCPGFLKVAAYPDYLPEGTAFDFLHGIQGECHLPVLINPALEAAPGIPLIPVQAQPYGGGQALIPGFHLGQPCKAAGGRVKGGPDNAVVQGQAVGVLNLKVVIFQKCGLIPGHIEHLHPVGGNLCLEQESAPSPQGGVAHLGIGMNPLIRNLVPFVVHQLQVVLAEPFQLCLHQAPVGLAGSIADKQREAVVSRGNLLAQLLHSDAPDDSRLSADGSHLHHSLVPSRPDGGAPKGIVEFIEQKELPEIFHLGRLRHPAAPCQLHHAHEPVRLHKPLLCLAVQTLEGGVDAVAAGVDFFKGPCKGGLIFRICLPEEGIQGGEVEPGMGEAVLQAADALDIGLGGAAAVVSHPVKDRHLVPLGCPVQGILDVFHRGVVEPGGVLPRQAQGLHPAAVRPLPAEQRLLDPGAHEHIGVHAGLGENLGQGTAVSKAVDIKADMAAHPQLLLQIVLTVKSVADKGLAAGEQAVRLDEPAPYQLHPPLLNPLLQPGEQLRVNPLNPLQKCGGGAGEPELRIFLHPVQGRGQGGLDLLHTLLPGPEPHRVDVGVANHV